MMMVVVITIMEMMSTINVKRNGMEKKQRQKQKQRGLETETETEIVLMEIDVEPESRNQKIGPPSSTACSTKTTTTRILSMNTKCTSPR